MRAKPATTREMVSQLWEAVIGSGEDSINSRLIRVEQQLAEMNEIVKEELQVYPCIVDDRESVSI